ncbi:PREDICTED: UPF0691 protein C9orf116 homolog [Amphimedon queenslandica]|uniref:Uncharacterized protein n=1 Tax=Amphimedon queenslandica TaxID=400682 RepID=A0AAN0IJV0_AMPQE|nr:PREDICTED: UPF0691 protein C9orf116 homolog [Amphimedon queenslandica]|eukprot:XP_011402586.2 PREDICTED: UPF0691 protein C9orf116 homolog [Amphimedon queenslandica]
METASPRLPNNNMATEESRVADPPRTSDFYRTKNIPERFDRPDLIKGYNTVPQNPMYRTSSVTYGSQPPSVHTMPTQYYGKSQAFTKHLGAFGMFRNHSLNTAKDRSKV